MLSRKRHQRNGDVASDGKEGKRKNKKTVTIETEANGGAQPSVSSSNGIGSNVLSQTLHNTKQALKSSLSSLFSSNRNNDLDSEFNLMGYPLELKNAKLQKNKWMLLSVRKHSTARVST